MSFSSEALVGRLFARKPEKVILIYEKSCSFICSLIYFLKRTCIGAVQERGGDESI